MKRKAPTPIIVYVEEGVVNGYQIPESVKVLVVDLDKAKHEGHESTALRWIKRVLSGETEAKASKQLKWEGWYMA